MQQGLQVVYDFFLGTAPDPLLDPTGHGIYMSAKMLIGIIMFTSIIGLFSWLKGYVFK